MLLTEQKYEELLVEPGHIEKVQFDDALAKSKSKKISLEQSLVEEGYIDDVSMGHAIADGLDYRFVNLKTLRISDEIFKALPLSLMRTHQAIIFEMTPESMKVATTNPWDKTFITSLEKDKGKKVEVYFATSQSITEKLHYFKSDLGLKLNTIILGMKTHPDETEHILALLDGILEYAYENHASDIHIEPLLDEVSVRFRIDGVLHHMANYPKSAHERVVSRIKILSRLRIDEHSIPQDGRFTFQKEDTHFDLRVSLAPITNGENIVMRLLETHARKIPLDDLGISVQDIQKISHAIQKPYGMILVVGPTGSGKTTTLYAFLELLNSPEVNIMTIEDPVEYTIPSVQQMQVNAEKELLFSTGLRSIVRQDPDIIMVGEIRDNETADIAVNAAMTGHLLLSTMHANDAVTTFPRMSEMQIEPFLTASSVVLVVGQRLVRKICEQCKLSYVMTPEEIELFKYQHEFAHMLVEVAGKSDLSHITLYKGMGCNLCGHTGYLDRVGIFEVIEVEEKLRALIIANASAKEISTEATRLGVTSMLYDGMVKVTKGITTLSEVIRTIKA